MQALINTLKNTEGDVASTVLVGIARYALNSGIYTDALSSDEASVLSNNNSEELDEANIAYKQQTGNDLLVVQFYNAMHNANINDYEAYIEALL